MHRCRLLQGGSSEVVDVAGHDLSLSVPPLLLMLMLSLLLILPQPLLLLLCWWQSVSHLTSA